ncbi:ent-kaurene oxidase [Clohesyomyces aquaticus]|uniref:Ent-kaurene oxidase n=1 Tax=Clohesyomyces aquaticus TaxID=1231657 RepID=A0A1Y1YQQ7_9PLEO|nr:ent-kaurene oxidase [Clohesyomyces aquaticus]
MSKLPDFGISGEKGRQEYLKSARKIYTDGYKRFKNSIYRLATSDGTTSIVVAPQFLTELRKLPDDVLSFPKAVEEIMEAKYTNIVTDEPLVNHTVRADLTTALARLNPIICSEVEDAMKDEMPTCEEWTTVPIYTTLVKIVAKVSGRVFVGPELCHTEEYQESAISYTMEIINVLNAIKGMRPILRPFLAPRLPEVKNLKDREKKAKAFLEPIAAARKKGMKDPEWKRPDDMLQWMLNRSEEYGVDSTERLVKCQLGLIFAAIHTTTLTLTNILYTLAVTPQYIQPLRQDIRAALENNDGVMTSRALQQMEKLDSYMKECVRFYPPGFTSFTRKVLKGITLSNGQYIPPGANIETPTIALNNDNRVFPDAEDFDGFRFYKLRKGGSTADIARNQFVTTNETNLSFGYGRHACPGRFFAANEIKMILARCLLEYDVKNADGVKERYSNIETGRQLMPDPTKQLMFRKVKA